MELTCPNCEKTVTLDEVNEYFTTVGDSQEAWVGYECPHCGWLHQRPKRSEDWSSSPP